MSSNSVHGEVYTIQHYVIKFVSGFVWVFRFPPPILKWLTSLDVVFYTEVFVNIFHLNQMVICMLLRVCFFQILFFLNDEIFMKMLLIVLKYFFISWLSSKEYYVENLTKFIIIFFIIFFLLCRVVHMKRRWNGTELRCYIGYRKNENKMPLNMKQWWDMYLIKLKQHS